MVRDFRVEREDEEAARWPILVILLVALAVRLAGIGYGLPWCFDREEQRTVRQAFDLTAHNWRPVRSDRPLFMDYIVAGEYGGAFAVGHMIGRIGPIHEFERVFLTRPSLFIVLARLASIFFGICAIYVIYSIGRMVSEWAVGIMAASIVAFSPHHIALCRSGAGESLAFLLFVLGVRCLIQLAQEKQLGSALKAAFFFGLAASADWRLITFLAFAYAAYFLVIPREYRPSATILGLPLVAIAFVFGFLIPSATLLLKPAEFLDGLKAAFLASVDVKPLLHVASSSVWLKELVALDIFSLAVGWALFAAGLLGLLWGIAGLKWKRLSHFVLALSLVAAFILLFPRDLDGFVRWALFLTPPLALGAAHLSYCLIWRKHVPATVGIIAMAFFTAIIAVQPAAESAIMTLRRTANDTRSQFAQWAKSDLPDLSSVLAAPGGRFLFRASWLRGGDQWGLWREAVLEKWNRKAFRVVVLPIPPVGSKLPPLSDFDYVVTDDWTLRELELLGTTDARAALALLDDARNTGRLLQTFEAPPKSLFGFGPRIQVFELPAAATQPPAGPPPAGD